MLRQCSRVALWLFQVVRAWLTSVALFQFAQSEYLTLLLTALFFLPVSCELLISKICLTPETAGVQMQVLEFPTASFFALNPNLWGEILCCVLFMAISKIHSCFFYSSLSHKHTDIQVECLHFSGIFKTEIIVFSCLCTDKCLGGTEVFSPCLVSIQHNLCVFHLASHHVMHPQRQRYPFCLLLHTTEDTDQ